MNKEEFLNKLRNNWEINDFLHYVDDMTIDKLCLNLNYGNVTNLMIFINSNYPDIDNSKLILALIKYFNQSKNYDIDFCKELVILKKRIMYAGKLKKIITDNKDLIMDLVNISLESILEREFDKDKIDRNLIMGAKKRKEEKSKIK